MEYIVSRRDGKDVTPKQIQNLAYSRERLDKELVGKDGDTRVLLETNKQLVLVREKLLSLTFSDFLEATKEKKLKENANDEMSP